MSDALKEALLKLSLHERALVFSRVIDEKSYAELDGICRVSSPTLRKRYERAFVLCFRLEQWRQQFQVLIISYQ